MKNLVPAIGGVLFSSLTGALTVFAIASSPMWQPGWPKSSPLFLASGFFGIFLFMGAIGVCAANGLANYAYGKALPAAH